MRISVGFLGTLQARPRSARALVARSRITRWWAIVLVALLATITPQGAPSAQAAAPISGGPVTVPLLNQGAAAAWGYLVDEAKGLLMAHGTPKDLTEPHARALMRSYVYLQLIHIIDEAHSGQTLSPQDQTALAYLEAQMAQERHWEYVDAFAKYQNFATTQQDCVAGTGPVYSDGSPGMGGIGCVFAQAFGSQPSAAQFTAVGFTEATRAFTDSAPATALFDTAYSLSWWGTLSAAEGETPEQVQFGEVVKDVLRDKLREVGVEALQEAGTALFELGAGESGAASWAVAAVALALIAASGIWNRADNLSTANRLHSNATSTPTVGIDELAQLSGSPGGATELLYVVMGETLPPGQATPSTATGSNAFPCSFEASASCSGYTLAADPDHVTERYAADAATPPAHTAGDPDFLLRQQGSGTKTVSATMQRVDASLVPWIASDRQGNALLYDASSARDVSANTTSLTTVAVGDSTSFTEHNLYSTGNGYTSYIHNNMFVTQLAHGSTTPAWSADPATWMYQSGVRYVDWQGNWWQAWYRDGTFLHVKVASPLGSVTPGDGSIDFGLGPCVYDPVVLGGSYASLYRFDGRGRCLFADDASKVSTVSKGDAVLVDGQMRVVTGTSECYYIDQDNLSLAAAVATWAHCGNTTRDFGRPLTAASSPHPCPGADAGLTSLTFCTNPDIAANAIELQPGVSSEWSAWKDFLGSLLDIPSETFSLGAKDAHAMKLVRANTCAGRSGCTDPTNLANCSTALSGSSTGSADCFVSPTIQYKATVAGAEQNWSATLVQAPTVTVTALHPTEGQAGSGPVATFTTSDANASPTQFSAQVVWGDGASSAGTVATAQGGGFVVTGGHTYGEEGTYPLAVNVTDSSTQLTGTGRDAVSVADAPLTSQGSDTHAVEGSSTSVTVATFSDQNPIGDVADFTAGSGSTTIAWGDGSTSSGSVTQTGPGTFSVSGTHTFTEEGNYPVAVTVTDTGGQTTTATSSAIVADAPVHLTASSTIVSTNPVGGVLATLRDENPTATVADFTSQGGTTTVDWGDGTTSAANIVQTGPGTFAVSGQHTYTQLGPYDLTVGVTDDGGSATTATVRVVVFAFPAGGSFVVGDQNLAEVGGKVTFWGSQWAKDNSLSAGEAPSSFKGFENSVTSPACSTAWTSDTGDSSEPPNGPLPSYMGVIVSGQIASSGSVISGDTRHIAVIVPSTGYGPSPGHYGTGTIVANAC